MYIGFVAIPTKLVVVFVDQKVGCDINRLWFCARVTVTVTVIA